MSLAETARIDREVKRNALMDALGDYIDARISYAETRRGPAAEYASTDEIDKSAKHLEKALDDVLP